MKGESSWLGINALGIRCLANELVKMIIFSSELT